MLQLYAGASLLWGGGDARCFIEFFTELSLPLESARIPKSSFRWRFMYKISSIFIFSLFFFFQYDFIIYVDFTHIAASNTATDDVTN